MKKSIKIAFLGCGNMSSAIAIDIHNSKSQLQFDIEILTYTPSKTRAIDLASAVEGVALDSLSDFKKFHVHYWILGFKPQQLEAFSRDNPEFLKDQNIISMLAGTTIKKLENKLASKHIIRIMPNTPIKIGHGITLFYAKNFAENYLEFKELFNSSTLIECKSERELDILTTFSGCGPAYIFQFADTMVQKMLTLGFEVEVARSLVNALFKGSSELMNNTEHSLTDLLDQVTSKGGVTIEAINSYRVQKIYQLTSNAIDAAIKRTDELNKE